MSVKNVKNWYAFTVKYAKEGKSLEQGYFPKGTSQFNALETLSREIQRQDPDSSWELISITPTNEETPLAY